MITPPQSTRYRDGVRLFLALAAVAVVLAGCPNPTNPPPLSQAQKILQDVRSRSLKSLIHGADPAARAVIDSPSRTSSENANILLYITGGPVYDPAPLTLDAIGLQIAAHDNYARVIVKQEQMIRRADKTLPTDRTITDKEAEEINLYSAAIIYAVGEKFQRMGYKVSIYSHSFGSFVVPEMLRRYGDKPFERILIAAGRLDMPEAIVQSFFDGKAAGFNLDADKIASQVSLEHRTKREDVDLQIKNDTTSGGFCGAASKKDNPMAAEICTGDTVDENKKTKYINADWSLNRLQADLGRNRYTALLKDKLSKVIYYFGGQDISVGSLTVREVNTLAGKSTGSGSVTSLTPDSSRPVTRNGVTRTVHTINDASGRVAVRYSLEDGHNLPILFEDTQKDILDSFTP